MKQKNRENIRLYIEASLADAAVIGLDGNDTHYLKSVMRCREGDSITLFNGRDGEWSGRIDGFGKNWTSLTLLTQQRGQTVERSCTLLFAVIKRSRSDLLLQKATELGATRIQPITTQRSQSERFNLDRAKAVVKEAAEQSGRLNLPEISQVRGFDDALKDWPEDQTLWFCDETAVAGSFADALLNTPANPAGEAILIGPEGGFDRTGVHALRSYTVCKPISLGSRILRAETAAMAALAIFQSVRDADKS